MFRPATIRTDEQFGPGVMGVVRSPGGTWILPESSRAIVGRSRFQGRFDATSPSIGQDEGCNRAIAAERGGFKRCGSVSGQQDLSKGSCFRTAAVTIDVAESSAVLNSPAAATATPVDVTNDNPTRLAKGPVPAKATAGADFHALTRCGSATMLTERWAPWCVAAGILLAVCAVCAAAWYAAGSGAPDPFQSIGA